MDVTGSVYPQVYRSRGVKVLGVKRHVPRAVALKLSESCPHRGVSSDGHVLHQPAPTRLGLPREAAPFHWAQQREPSAPELLVSQGRRKLHWTLKNEGFGRARWGAGRETAVRTQHEAKIPLLEGAPQTSTRAFRLTR